jgi:hypothetical protein
MSVFSTQSMLMSYKKDTSSNLVSVVQSRAESRQLKQGVQFMSEVQCS